jgi:hypothetical protein
MTPDQQSTPAPSQNATSSPDNTSTIDENPSTKTETSSIPQQPMSTAEAVKVVAQQAQEIATASTNELKQPQATKIEEVPLPLTNSSTITVAPTSTLNQVIDQMNLQEQKIKYLYHHLGLQKVYEEMGTDLNKGVYTYVKKLMEFYGIKEFDNMNEKLWVTASMVR